MKTLCLRRKTALAFNPLTSRCNSVTIGIMRRPAKRIDLLVVVRSCIAEGRYLDTRHATQRGEERDITRPEILYVLKSGHHESHKDHFDEFHEAWNYAIRGKTVDGRSLRVVVSFDEGLLIITAIDLDR